MINALTVDPALFTGSTRLILDEMKTRGWKVDCLKEGSSHLFIDRGDGKGVHTFGSTPPQQSYSDGMLSNNKYLTNLLLAQAGIPQLPFITVGTEDTEKLKAFVAEHPKVVVKPVDGSHGDGIRLGVEGLNSAIEATEYARKFTSMSRVLVQKQFAVDAPYDLRLLCMSGKFVAAIHRMPARVFGDGTNTIKKLIEIENNRDERGKAYMFTYASIDNERAHKYMGEAIHTVPSLGQEVRVMDVANYGAGGELIDVTDEIPNWMIQQAELASKELGVVVAGVDYLTSELPTANTKPEDIESTIIEINKSPALMIHDEPHVGKSRHTVKRYVDLLASY